ELSAEQREAILLKVYQGFLFDEIAEILSCPVSTVKSRIYSGLELMKKSLSEDVGSRGAFKDQISTETPRSQKMNCQDAKPLLFDRLLEGGKNRDLDAHLSSCSACREELASLELTHKLM